MSHESTRHHSKSAKNEKKKNNVINQHMLLQDNKSLRQDGKTNEAEALLDDEMDRIRDIMRNKLGMKEEHEITADRSWLPEPGKELISDERIALKSISSEEREKYLALEYENSSMKYLYENQDYRDAVWNIFMSENSAVFSVYESANSEFIGYCMIKDIRETDWEIGIELHEAMRNKGYGTAALRMMLEKLHEITGHRFFNARIELDNFASQELFRVVGAYPDGVREFLLTGDELDEYQKNNRHLIDENIRRVAEEFSKKPEDILGYVLNYRIDMECRRK